MPGVRSTHFVSLEVKLIRANHYRGKDDRGVRDDESMKSERPRFNQPDAGITAVNDQGAAVRCEEEISVFTVWRKRVRREAG